MSNNNEFNRNQSRVNRDYSNNVERQNLNDIDRNDKHIEDIQLHEERLRVNKERVKRGEIVVNKLTSTELEEIDVPVERDEFTVERIAIEGEPLLEDYNNDESNNEGLDVIRIPVTEERIEVIKRTVVTEEIVVRKNIIEDVEHIKGEVKKQDIEVHEVDNDGNVVRDGLARRKDE